MDMYEVMLGFEPDRWDAEEMDVDIDEVDTTEEDEWEILMAEVDEEFE